MKRRALVPLACCLLLLGVTFAFGDTLSEDRLYLLLVKAARAPMQVAFSGTVVELDSRDGQSRRVVLRVEHLPGLGDRVSILDPPELARRLPHPPGVPGFLVGPGAFRGIAQLSFPAFQQELRDNLALLLANYTLSAQDSDSVAGRATYRVEIVPKFPEREEKGIWIDRDTGIVLKVETRLPYNTETRTAYFSDIQQQPDNWALPPVELRQLSPSLPQPLAVQHDETLPGITDPEIARDLLLAQARATFKLLSPRYLPAGFVLDDVRNVAIREENDRPAVHLLFSDGLSSISLFLQPSEPMWPDQIRHFFFGDPHDRRVHEHGFTVLEGTKDGTRYVLVSDIGAGDLGRIAASLMEIAR